MKHELLAVDADRKYMGGYMQYIYLKVLTLVKEKHMGNPEYPSLAR
jgi:hypothetical protein